MLNAILVCFSATVIICFLPNKQIVLKSIYQVVNVFINAMYPFIDMYTYVRSEIDEFNKEEKEHSEVNETDVLNKETNGKNKEKMQYYDVKEFVDKLATKKDLYKLENKIDKRRKKLKKEQFSDSKRYVKKFATLENLDNLKKIIDEKRDELKNNNDEEKHVD